ncbi:MAG TPA: hypothetical protein PK939_00280, partial [Bacteroidales bacterium]|nr:hypothetical protein [Bacteroidales bacterium]
MKNFLKTAGLWLLSLLLMGAFAIYQRTTGPTYPVSGKVVIKGETVKYKLLRSHDTGMDAPIDIKV